MNDIWISSCQACNGDVERIGQSTPKPIYCKRCNEKFNEYSQYGNGDETYLEWRERVVAQKSYCPC